MAPVGQTAGGTFCVLVGLTGLLAAPARLGADPAVLVHLGVALAPVTAALAPLGAGLQHRRGQIGVIAGVTGK